MTYRDRLQRYRDQGPAAAGPFALQPAAHFRELVGDLGDGVLLPLGWARATGLRWTRALRDAVTLVLELRPMKAGVAARWGLALAFVPALKSPRPLDLSYDPLDHERETSRWSFSQFETDEELREDGAELFRHATAEADVFGASARDLEALRDAFEHKKQARSIRLPFAAYPQEALAYAAVLGLLGRRAEAEAELATMRTAPPERVLRALHRLWERGL